MVKLKNISGGQIVCDLADGTILRLDNKKEEIFNEKQITKHINNLVKQGLLFSSTIVEKQRTTTDKKSSRKEKEVEKDGTI